MLISFITRANPKLRLTGKSLSVQQDAPEFEWLVTGEPVSLELEGVTPVFVPDINAAIQSAKGKYLWFLDDGACLADAYAMRDVAREIRISFIPDFICADAREDGHIIRASDLDKFIYGPVTPYAAMLYAKAGLKDVRFENFYEFTLRFITQTPRHHYMARIISDVFTQDLSIDTNAAVRRELGIVSDTKNDLIVRMNTATEQIKKKYPGLYWFLRNRIQPSERKNITQFRRENPEFQPKPVFKRRRKN